MNKLSEREKKRLNYLINSLFVIGILCCIYFGIVVGYAGIRTAFGWFWCFGGISCIVSALVLRVIAKADWKLPIIVTIPVIGLCLIGIVMFLIIEGTIVMHANMEPNKNADYVIVLGAQVRGTRITKSLKARLDTAIDYLEENDKTTVIVSGGQGNGEDISEGAAMKAYLLENGIEESRIISEDQSTNTFENISYSKMLIQGDNKKVVIVTNGFHIYRAVSIAKKQRIGQTEGLAAPTNDVLRINYYVREVLAVVKDKLVGNI